MTAKLSAGAERALINTGSNRQGATIPSTTTQEVAQELRRAGLVGLMGLTRAGTIARERLVNRVLDEAF